METNHPNFMIIGAIKAGTTSLYHYLRAHPEVYMSPKKEPGYYAVDPDRPADEGFNQYAIRDRDSYLAQFDGVSGETAIGEASPQYLWSPLAPKRVQHDYPEIKLIMGLRNPADRAFSSYMHLRREGGEKNETFEGGLKEEPRRIAAHLGPLWRYREVGRYAEQLERWFAAFRREQMFIYLYEDLQHDASLLLSRLHRFLGVRQDFEPDLTMRFNVSGIPKSRKLHRWTTKRTPFSAVICRILPVGMRQRLVHGVQGWNIQRRRMDPEIRARLLEEFRADILRTQELIGRDLSSWLGQKPSNSSERFRSSGSDNAAIPEE